jgi:uncharacterized protein (DUF1330 family)
MGISKPLSGRSSRTRKVNVDGEFNSALNAYSLYKAMSLGMVKGYWVALADITDPQGYKAYIEENANAFRKYGGRFLTRGGTSERPEGITRSRIVVIEFPDYAAALECYRSPEYAKAMALRQGKSVMDLAIVEGYDGPQPSTDVHD